MRLALAHAKHTPVPHLQRRGFQGDQEEQHPIGRRRPGTGRVHAQPTGGPRLPLEPPRRHVGLKRGLERRDQLLKFVERQAGHIQARCGAILHVGALAIRHESCRLLREAQYAINRDKLMY